MRGPANLQSAKGLATRLQTQPPRCNRVRGPTDTVARADHPLADGQEQVMFAFWKLTTGVVGSVMVTVCSVPPAAASSGDACTAIAAELAAKTPVTPRAQRRASMCNASRSPDWVRAPLVHRLFPPDCRDGSHWRSVPSRESRVSPGTSHVPRRDAWRHGIGRPTRPATPARLRRLSSG